MRFTFHPSFIFGRLTYLALALFLLLGVAGCSKNEDAGNTFEYPPSDSTLAGDYRVTASLYYPSAQESAQDDYALWDSCRRATQYHFYDSKEYLEENLADCMDNMPGAWDLNGTNLVIKTLGIVGDTITNSYPLQRFNLTSFTIRDNGSQGDYYIKTYTRQ
jgi:hypothetical protein